MVTFWRQMTPKRALARVGGAVLGLSAFGHFLGLVKILTAAEAPYVERLGGTVGSALLLKVVMLAVTGGGAWYLFKYAARR